MTRGFFVRQMAAYVAFHRSPINRATHFVGIPMIIFGILLQLTAWRAPLGGDGVSAALLVAAGAWALWIALAPTIGLAMGCFLVPTVLLAEFLAARWSAGTLTLVAGGFFVAGWIFQLTGHVFEGRRPALVSNLFQAPIGPMFLAAEILQMLGFARALHRDVERAAAERGGPAAAHG